MPQIVIDGKAGQQQSYDSHKPRKEGIVLGLGILPFYLTLLFLGMISGGIEVGLASEQTLLGLLQYLSMLLPKGGALLHAPLCLGSLGAVEEQLGIVEGKGIAAFHEHGFQLLIDSLHLIVLAQQTQRRGNHLPTCEGLT